MARDDSSCESLWNGVRVLGHVAWACFGDRVSRLLDGTAIAAKLVVDGKEFVIFGNLSVRPGGGERQDLGAIWTTWRRGDDWASTVAIGPGAERDRARQGGRRGQSGRADRIVDGRGARVVWIVDDGGRLRAGTGNQERRHGYSPC